MGYIIIRCQGVNVKPIRWRGGWVGGLVKIRARDQRKGPKEVTYILIRCKD